MAYRNDLGLMAHEARVNVTWNGQNGDLMEPVPFTATDRQLKEWAREALIGGSIPGVQPTGQVNMANYVVDRFTANGTVSYNRIFLRPTTPFG
jgi:hypothetical protein